MRSVHSQQPDECGTGRGQRVGSVCMCRQVCEAEFLLVTRGRWGEKQPGSSSQLRQENSCWEVVGGGVGGRRGGLSVQHARSLPHTVQKPHTNRCTEEAPPENTGNVDKHTHTNSFSHICSFTAHFHFVLPDWRKIWGHSGEKVEDSSTLSGLVFVALRYSL